MKAYRVSVLGMGKLGLPLAALLASSGHVVVGADTDPHVVERVSRGIGGLYEPGLEDLLRVSGPNLKVTVDLKGAVGSSELSFIVVPTPSLSDGSFSTEYVATAVGMIGEAIRDKPESHTVAVVSTLSPGSMSNVVKPHLERSSGKRSGVDIGLCYNPEFIALGSVLNDLQNPDFVLVGESDRSAGAGLEALWKSVCRNNPRVFRTSFENAELAKISINVFVTMKISFANSLAMLAEALPTGNVDEISNIVGADSRIGRRYLRGGLGYGGPCFPRDNRAFNAFAERLGFNAPLSSATDQVNSDTDSRVTDRIVDLLGGVEGKTIAILGLTYKPNTSVIEESASTRIASKLIREGATIRGYDPGVRGREKVSSGDRFLLCESIRDCLDGAELCLLAVPWPEFSDITPELLRECMRRPLVFDCWRMLELETQDIEYVALGRA